MTTLLYFLLLVSYLSICFSFQERRDDRGAKEVHHYEAAPISDVAHQTFYKKQLVHREKSHNCKFPTQKLGHEGMHPKEVETGSEILIIIYYLFIIIFLYVLQIVV